MAGPTRSCLGKASPALSVWLLDDLAGFSSVSLQKGGAYGEIEEACSSSKRTGGCLQRQAGRDLFQHRGRRTAPRDSLQDWLGRGAPIQPGLCIPSTVPKQLPAQFLPRQSLGFSVRLDLEKRLLSPSLFALWAIARTFSSCSPSPARSSGASGRSSPLPPLTGRVS